MESAPVEVALYHNCTFSMYIKRLFVFIISVLLFTKMHAQSLSSYQYLVGNIGGFPVVMHLHKGGHHYNGYYYYSRTEQPVYVNGSDTLTRDGKIRLLAFVSGEGDNELFTLQPVEGGYTGEWQKSRVVTR
ncbi:MAG: hypothetical protein KF746_01200 [Chitinophagaceae bacterium]|nr:hypothetical protein [Chitinophagaceae bacterium]